MMVLIFWIMSVYVQMILPDCKMWTSFPCEAGGTDAISADILPQPEKHCSEFADFALILKSPEEVRPAGGCR